MKAQRFWDKPQRESRKIIILQREKKLSACSSLIFCFILIKISRSEGSNQCYNPFLDSFLCYWQFSDEIHSREITDNIFSKEECLCFYFLPLLKHKHENFHFLFLFSFHPVSYRLILDFVGYLPCFYFLSTSLTHISWPSLLG